MQKSLPYPNICEPGKIPLMKRKSRYEPLETDIAKILTPNGNHEKATTTTVTYDMV